MKRLLFILTFLVSAIPPAATQSARHHMMSGGVHTATVLFSTGQSNDVGVTNNGGAGLPSDWYDPQPRINMWWNNHFESMWIDHNTVDASILGNADTHWGPEQTWSHAVQSRTGQDVFVYKQAIGGIPISYWQPGGLMYNRIHSDLPILIDSLRGRGYSRIKFVIAWLQGEANISGSALSYQTALEGVIDDLRGISPTMQSAPFIMVKLSPDYTYFAAGQANTFNVAYTNITSTRSNCYTLDRHALGCVANTTDNIHDDDASKMIIGNALYELCLSIGLL